MTKAAFIGKVKFGTFLLCAKLDLKYNIGSLKTLGIPQTS